MKANKFFRNFYGIAEEKKQQEKSKKFSWADFYNRMKLSLAQFYNRKKFILWMVLGFSGMVVTTIFFGLSIENISAMVGILGLYLIAYIYYCIFIRDTIDKDNTSYQNFCIFWIWSSFTWTIYCGLGLLFIDRQDLLPSHQTGLILGTVTAVIFTYFLPPISYWLKLNASYNENEEQTSNEKLLPTPKDKKMHRWIMLIVTLLLSSLTILISVVENRELTNKRQELQLEQMAFEDITNKTFIVKDNNWLEDDVYAIIETADEIVAVKVVDYPEACTATKVKVLINDTIIISKNKYPTSDKISFEIPAPE